MENNITAKPTKQQLEWQNCERGMFCHFGMDTFYDQEWGNGTEDPKKFNPTELDAEQWVKTAKNAGFKYFILTAKHHDGFCLWPTKTTEHSIKNSPYKNGKGDLVGECAKACEKENIKFGVYLSPWDRHEKCYANKEKYDAFYKEQLKELLTSYGKLFEIWFDGAGSENREYDWQGIMELVKKYQPDAMIFNMGRPTIRWVGNEDGLAPDPCWCGAKESKVSMFTNDMMSWLPDTPEWVPAECDVPLRKPHWFWHPNDEKSVMTKDQLMDAYYRSVGHGCNLLLNISPDTRGLMPQTDVDRVIEFNWELKRRFEKPVAQTSNNQAEEIVLDLCGLKVIDTIVLAEEIAYGERVKEYYIEAETENGWEKIAEGFSIGHKKINPIKKVLTTRIRLHVTKSAAVPLIKTFAAYLTE